MPPDMGKRFGRHHGVLPPEFPLQQLRPTKRYLLPEWLELYQGNRIETRDLRGSAVESV